MINLKAGKIITITGSVASSGSAYWLKSGADSVRIGDVNSTPLILGPYVNDALIDVTMTVGSFSYFYNGEGDQVPTDLNSSIIIVSSGSRTMRKPDVSKYIRMNSGSSQTFTVLSDSEENIQIGSEVALEQSGEGELTVVAGSGVTIVTSSSLVFSGRYATAVLKKLDSNYWILSGNLV